MTGAGQAAPLVLYFDGASRGNPGPASFGVFSPSGIRIGEAIGRTSTIKSVEPKGAVVTLSLDVEGYLRASEISNGRVEDAGTVLKAGDNIEAMIINVDRKSRSIQLSIKARDNAETADSMQRLSEASASSGTTNLGALLKAKLDQARDTD